MADKLTKKVLLQDLIIPAGTVFMAAPTRTDRADGDFIDCTIGLTKNTFGTVTYQINADGSVEDEAELKKWFADLR